MKRRMQVLLAFLFGLVAGAAASHHAPTIYDLDRSLVIAGTVIAFEWRQPHTWTTVETLNAAGHVETWRLEGMNPGYLGRRGWTRHTLKPGDAIEVTFYPRKDGTRNGLFLRARLADGSERVMAVEPVASGP